MDPPSGRSPVSAAPPWPPDLCFVSRDGSSSGDYLKVSTTLLHPEVSSQSSPETVALSPLEPVALSSPESAALSSEVVPPTLHASLPEPPTKAFSGPSSSPPSASWVSKLQSSGHNLT